MYAKSGPADLLSYRALGVYLASAGVYPATRSSGARPADRSPRLTKLLGASPSAAH